MNLFPGFNYDLDFSPFDRRIRVLRLTVFISQVNGKLFEPSFDGWVVLVLCGLALTHQLSAIHFLNKLWQVLLLEFAGVKIDKPTSGSASFVIAHTQGQIELSKPVITLILCILCMVLYQLLQVSALICLLNLVSCACKYLHLQLEVLLLNLFCILALPLLFCLFLLRSLLL